MIKIILIGSSLLILITGLTIASLFNLPMISHAQILPIDNFVTYANLTSGIFIQYPTNWTETEVKNGVIFQSPSESSSDQFKEQVGVSVSPSSGNINTLSNELVNQEINTLQSSFPGFQLDQSIPITLASGNAPAHMIVYTYNDDTLGMLKAMKVITLQGTNLYKISYFAQPDKYDSYLPIIQKTIDSFQAGSAGVSTTVEPKTPPPSPVDPQTEANIRTFNNPDFGFKMQYPSDWTVTENNEGFYVAFEAPYTDESEDYYAPDILIGPDALYRGALQTSIDDLISYLEEEYENFELTDSSPATAKSDSEAHKIVYTYEDETFGDLKSMEILFKDAQGKYHDITYTAEPDEFDQFMPTAQKMIDSFEPTK